MKKNPKNWPIINSMTMDESIDNMIAVGTLYSQPVKGVTGLYERYLSWLKNPHILSIKFEDLIGSNGGADTIKQYETIKKIISHLDIEVSAETIDYVIANLFGNKESNTFRKGQIGEWKQYFTPAHKEAFKKHAGQLLIDLGYEKDMNW